MKFTLVILTATLLAPLGVLNAADLKLAAVFSDHMVLQRDKPVPVWGWADPGTPVTVTFGGQTKPATADAAGKWMVELDPLAASAEARELVAKSQGAGHEARVTDVLVGEVWLGSGQSNMAMTVSRARDFEAEKAAAKQPLIRMFKEESRAANSPQADANGTWVLCSPESVGAFSATLYFFGRELHRDLHMPVGLINSSVGGTPIESWIAAAARAKCPELKTAPPAQTKTGAARDKPQAKDRYPKQPARWKEQAAKAKAAGQPAPKRPLDPAVQRSRGGGAGDVVRGSELVVSFSHCDGGLQAKGGALTGFVIAGADRQWQPAAARIDGDKVIVSSPQVKEPVAVRYAWQADPVCNLANAAGLPASPFRTDAWPEPAAGPAQP